MLTTEVLQLSCKIITVVNRTVSLTVERLDGSVVDLELLRPEWWVEANELCVGQLLPLQVEELEVDGHATVTAIEPCPALAAGIGSVVTGRFVTRRVDVLVEATIRSGDGTRETITGTPIHPIWSVTRNQWVPLGELTEGELLLGETDTAVVEARHDSRMPRLGVQFIACTPINRAVPWKHSL